MNRTLLSFALALLATTGSVGSCFAYDRTDASSYALAWWQTDVLGTQNANHINSSHAQSPGPYEWYFNPAPLGLAYNHDPGTDNIPEKYAEDCANFVSQALSSGGIHLPLADGIGGTIVGAARLGKTMANISEVTPFASPSAAPANLEAGDVIIFNKGTSFHATAVVSGSGPGAVLAAHGTDHNNVGIAWYLGSGKNQFPNATAYHIISSSFSASLGTAPPGIIVTSNGQPVTSGGFIGYPVHVKCDVC